MTSKWSNKVVWITGASSGIGRGLAAAIAARGGQVGLMARRGPLLEAVTGQIVESGGRAAWAVANVADSTEVRRAAGQLAAELGPCDVLIANAGIYRQTRVASLDPDAECAQMATNFGGVVNAIAAALPPMLARRGGHLVAIASLAARIGLPDAATYCASKAAIVRYMEALRVDLRPRGIRVTTVLPGTVDTPMITDAERPQAVPLTRAVHLILHAIERGYSEFAFPRTTTWSIRLARLLPPSLRDPIILRLESMPEVEPPPEGPSNAY